MYFGICLNLICVMDKWDELSPYAHLVTSIVLKASDDDKL